MSGPHLPPELECRIFEIAALARPTGIPHLILVARRVKHWVEPLLYRVFFLSSEPPYRNPPSYGFPIITPSTLLQLIAEKPPYFLQNTVKRIIVTGLIDNPQMEPILAACSHAFDYCYYTHKLRSAEALAQLHHLRRLTISLHGFLDCCSIDSTHSILANITHLDLHAISATREDLHWGLCLVSNLTHFAVNFTVRNRGFQTAPLRANTHLECIVFLVDGRLPVDLQEVHDSIEHDARFVCMARNIDFHLNWLRHTDTGRDFWALADAFIAARREGKIDRARYILSDTETSWLD
ncbi:hypothetical protein C8R45DRAFT_970432 [Mycena sanguinolenta]|nr:hypothetical protein C8R45DRAFT_970432 [Mycena sanguinolenta]